MAVAVSRPRRGSLVVPKDGGAFSETGRRQTTSTVLRGGAEDIGPRGVVSRGWDAHA
jgi:hypothetical protein